MKGIFYIHNNTPVIAAEMKPEEPHCHICGGVMEHTSDCGATIFIEINSSKQYETALKEWESQLIPAENVYSIDNENRVMLTIGEFTKKITPGNAIEYEGNVIHKIL